MDETSVPQGPWAVIGGEFPQQEDLRGLVAYFIKLPEGPVISRAHADLIEAAPDLYKELAHQASLCGACGGTGAPNRMSAMDDSRAADGSCSACYDMRAALAKARGETS